VLEGERKVNLKRLHRRESGAGRGSLNAGKSETLRRKPAVFTFYRDVVVQKRLYGKNNWSWNELKKKSRRLKREVEAIDAGENVIIHRERANDPLN